MVMVSQTFCWWEPPCTSVRAGRGAKSTSTPCKRYKHVSATTELSIVARYGTHVPQTNYFVGLTSCLFPFPGFPGFLLTQFPTFSLQNHFVSSGALEDLQSYQNSRFGSCIAAVPDLNQDSYNDVVIGAPLEDDHQGAIYIFLGFEETILKKYKQVQLPGLWLAPFFTNFTQGH